MALYQDVKESTDGSAHVNLQSGAGVAITETGGALDVNIASGSTSGAVADKTAFVYGTTNETPVGGVFQDTSPTLTSGTTGALRLNAERGLHVNLRAAAGTELLGQQTMAASIPVAIASNQGALTVSATDLDIRNLSNVQDDLLVYGFDGAANQKIKTDAAGELQVDVVSSALPTGAATETTLSAINGKASPGSAALTQVAINAASVSLLASSATRKGFILVNDANRVAYVAFAATATTSAYTIKLQSNSVYESGPFGCYTGAISAIWASAGTGNMVITSLS